MLNVETRPRLIMEITPKWDETVAGMKAARLQLGRDVTEAELQSFVLGEVPNVDSLQARKMTCTELADWFLEWDAARKDALAANA